MVIIHTQAQGFGSYGSNYGTGYGSSYGTGYGTGYGGLGYRPFGGMYGGGGSYGMGYGGMHGGGEDSHFVRQAEVRVYGMYRYIIIICDWV